MAFPTDLESVAPSVDVVFPSQSQLTPNKAPYSVNVTLASLALTQYAGVTGATGRTAVLQSSQIAVYDGTDTLTNGPALATLATQAATDFYLWSLAKLDIVIPGIAAWTPEGTSDAITWTHQGSQFDPLANVSTRIQRGSYHTYADLVTSLSPGSPGGSNTLTVQDGTTTVPNTTILEFPPNTVTQVSAGIALYTPAVNFGLDWNNWKQHTGIPVGTASWYTANAGQGALNGGLSISGNTLCAIPVIVDSTRTCLGIGFELSQIGNPGDKANIALYKVAGNSSVTPSTVLQHQENFALNPGAVPVILSMPFSQTVLGLYWILFVSNATCVINGITNGPAVGVLPATSTGGAGMVLPTWLQGTVGGFGFGPITAANPLDLSRGQSGTCPALLWQF